jgi:hypothetical protein
MYLLYLTGPVLSDDFENPQKRFGFFRGMGVEVRGAVPPVM